MTLFLIGLATFAATYIGGTLALRWKDKLHLVLGFSSGAVIGVAFFDLLPESLELASSHYDIPTITAVIAAGFLGFMFLNRVFLLHPDSEDEHCENNAHKGGVAAAGLAAHSFLDGVGVGLAFQVSPAVGAVVAAAVLAHDFSDGINTVGVVLRNGESTKKANIWLVVDALAPVVGIIASYSLSVADHVLGLLLAVFCGFFMYLGASDLLPESHHRHPQLITSLMTILGAVVIYGAIRIAGL